MVGFESSNLTVFEGDGFIEVCVDILSPTASTVNVLALLQTSMGTATGIAADTCSGGSGMEGGMIGKRGPGGRDYIKKCSI